MKNMFDIGSNDEYEKVHKHNSSSDNSYFSISKFDNKNNASNSELFNIEGDIFSLSPQSIAVKKTKSVTKIQPWDGFAWPAFYRWIDYQLQTYLKSKQHEINDYAFEFAQKHPKYKIVSFAIFLSILMPFMWHGGGFILKAIVLALLFVFTWYLASVDRVCILSYRCSDIVDKYDDKVSQILSQTSDKWLDKSKQALFVTLFAITTFVILFSQKYVPLENWMRKFDFGFFLTIFIKFQGEFSLYSTLFFIAFNIVLFFEFMRARKDSFAMAEKLRELEQEKYLQYSNFSKTDIAKAVFNGKFSN
ncbi:MAG: hypothetical protein RL154_300, partial [Pseudomonadota bacterium]|jgi:hypothetical protein